ncbi:MAG: hydrolase [Deltaproteobacteria bacterium]|nr:MAG: hydrolase [Deltaproteobacteria bacterium]
MTLDTARFQLSRDQAVLVVIDVQTKLTPAMPHKVYERMRATTAMLVDAARLLDIPVVTTEQYPQGIGPTVPELAAACTGGVIEKTSFGCCGEPAFMEALAGLGRRQAIVTGMEAHVCVYQTVLGLLAAGYHVHLVRDAVCSRHKEDFRAGVRNAARAGALAVTAEMVLFQLLGDSRHEQFRAISKLVKARG